MIDELYQAPRSWAERAYPKLIYYNKGDKGGHFAAWEQPEILVTDLRSAFKSGGVLSSQRADTHRRCCRPVLLFAHERTSDRR
jgi:hypothetical protein